MTKERCEKCESGDIIKKGTVERSSGEMFHRYRCKSCGHNFYEQITSASIDVEVSDMFNRKSDWFDAKLSKKTFVISSVQSNTEVNSAFLNSLKVYCDKNDAALMLIPVRYGASMEGVDTHSYPPEITDYLFENNISIHPKLRVLGLLKITATSSNPLSGLNPLSKGDSLIIGHSQLQLNTMPVQLDDHPVIITTTGSISKLNYSLTKQGYKAEFNHSMSAVVVELDGDSFHIRHLNFDGVGFYDLETYYDSNGTYLRRNPVTAVVTGDEHAIFMSDEVRKATYGEDGIVTKFKPTYIVRHDVLDCYSVSHHHKNDTITKYKKFVNKQNNIADEIQKTVEMIVQTTPTGSTNILVPSNHTDHLTKWLNECDIKNEPWNAKLYHWLMFSVYDAIDRKEENVDPFTLLVHNELNSNGVKTLFLNRRSTFKIHDIEVAIHGDKGANGSRGSRHQLANLPAKTVIGHSHSPGISGGCYQVGTSSNLDLEYNVGPSSWLNTHVIIHANGKRQLINIIKGKWRRE